MVGASSNWLPPEELYSSLALGVIDAAEWGTASAMYDLGLHEVAKYYVRPYYGHTFHGFDCINSDIWDELTPDLQAILTTATLAQNTTQGAMRRAKYFKNLREMVEDHGVKICYLPEEDVTLITEKTLDWVENDFGKISPRCGELAAVVLDAARTFHIN